MRWLGGGSRPAGSITRTPSSGHIDSRGSGGGRRRDGPADAVIGKWQPTPRVLALDEEQIADIRQRLNVDVVVPDGQPPAMPPIESFKDMNLHDNILADIAHHKYETPTPIQAQGIPVALSGRDILGCAETGSGKTAGFGIPMIQHCLQQHPLRPGDGPMALVLAPTRELAQQIDKEIRAFGRSSSRSVRSCIVVGGVSMQEQRRELLGGVEIVVATPGRFIDHLQQGNSNLGRVSYVVLDEADRMIDLGFEPQVNAVLEAMPKSTLKPEDEEAALDDNRLYRTMYMFSATMPTAVERLARKYLRRPIVVNIGSAGRVTDNVSQRVIVLKENEKPHRLETELEMVEEKRAIVFVNTKRQCDNVYAQLEGMGFRCAVLHGGRTQDQREISIKGFRDDTYNILIATDVAGRGIDVPDILLVINYDMPNNIESYTHRIGRTGRAGKKGTAITFLTGSKEDCEVYYDLKKLLEDSKAPVPPELARSEHAKQKPGSITNKRDQIQYAKK